MTRPADPAPPADAPAPGPASPAPSPDPPAAWREVAAVSLVALMFDLFIMRISGYAAGGLFLLGCVPLAACGSPFPRANRRGLAVVAGLLGLTAARLAWLGWGGAVCAGVVLLAALTLAAAGRRVWVLDLPAHLLQALPAAPAAAVAWRRLVPAPAPADPGAPPAAPAAPLSVALPAAAAAAFAGFFLLANPDLRAAFGEGFSRITARFGDAVWWLVPTPGRAVLWVLVAAAAAGSLRPLVRRSLLDPRAEIEDAALARRRSAGPAAAPSYAAVRNTLLAVVGVFAVYLPYELATLWRRDFPEGFYYAGFAHEGAAWLTAALAAATVLLSAMFRGRLPADPRAGGLRRLAWVWSALNFLLVAAVVNRLAIYVGYNGLSRMRVVGFLGIAAVALGFAATVVKVARDRGFVWLLRRQLRAAALVALFGVLLPVDYLCHAYNAARVAAGDPAPLAVVAHHDLDLGGLLALEPILDGGNRTAARGVAGLIARRSAALDRRGELRRGDPGPFAALADVQIARSQFRTMTARRRARIDALLAGTTPDRAVERLKTYAWRWW